MIKKLRKAVKLIFLNDRKIFRGLLLGVAASVEHVAMLAELRQIRSVIDVGSNKGQFLLIAKYFNPSCRYYGFEPLGAAYKKLTVLGSWFEDVSIFNVALGNDNREVDYYITHKEDSSSLLKVTSQQTRLFPGTELKDVTKVNLTKLDDYMPGLELIGPVLMKIDVQGGELDVLLGAREALKKIDYVYVECSYIELYKGQPLYEEVEMIMSRLGYVLHGEYNPKLSSKRYPIQSDFLFKKNS